MQRRSSFLTLAIAVVGYFAANLIQVAIQVALRAALAPMTMSMSVRTAIMLFCGVVATAAAGYLAALIRPAAAPVLAVLILVTSSMMIAFNPDTVSLWYEGSLLVLWPVAPIAGAALSRRLRPVRL